MNVRHPFLLFLTAFYAVPLGVYQSVCVVFMNRSLIDVRIFTQKYSTLAFNKTNVYYLLLC